jgi:hypothetical protein
MLLARQVDNSEHWVRIGIATIAEHEPNIALYGPDTDTVPKAEKEEIVQGMTREEIGRLLQDGANHNRRIFHRFDIAETQELMVW